MFKTIYPIINTRNINSHLRQQAILSLRVQFEESDVRWLHLQEDLAGNERDPFQI